MAKPFSFFKKLFWILLSLFTLGCVAGIILIIYFELQLPNVQKLKDVHLQVPLRVLSKDGKLIAEYGEKRRTPVSLKQIPISVIEATLATEDKRYFYHSGVDVLGLMRAGVVLVLTGKKEQGGSTITMQVARNYFLTRKKTYTRKIREILLAYKIDHALSKDKVLELYFNKIFYGNRAYGIAAAAQVYYGKPLDKLTLPQAAMLAGLPQAPSYLNPLANPKAAFKRRNHVLHRMLEQGYITSKQYQQASQAPIVAKYHGLKITVNAPYVAELIRNEMTGEYGKQAYTKGLAVHTTIDPKLQKEARIAVRKGVLAYDKRHGYRGPIKNLGQQVPKDLKTWQQQLTKIETVNNLKPAAVLKVDDQHKTITALLQSGKQVTIHWKDMKWARSQFFRGRQEYLGTRPKQPSDIVKIGDVIRTNKPGKHWTLSQEPQVESALIAMDPQNGAVRALTGGFSYKQSNFDRAVQAYRQPGSSFKPFIYSAALAKGFTLASMINDAPVVMPSDNESGLWRPENDTRKFYGMTSLKRALMESRNLVSIRLLQLIGIPYARNYVTRFGFKPDHLPHGLSLALGTASVTPLQMVTGYSTFANGGYKVEPHLISSIVNSHGKVIFQTNTPVVCSQHCQEQIKSDSQENNSKPTRPKAQQVITPQNAFLMTQAMKAVITDGTGRAALSLHRSDLAGKTGTTNHKKDAWFSGFNHHLVATAWMGFDQPRSLWEYGAKAALPIWIDFMGSALHDTPESTMAEPPGIVSVRINPKTGKAAAPGTSNATFEYFRQQHVPNQSSNAATGGSNDSESSTLEQQLY